MVDLEAAVPFPEVPVDRPAQVVFVENGDRQIMEPAKRGRPRKVYNQEILGEVLRLYFVEKLSMRQVADLVGVSHMSVYRMLSDPNVELLI